MRRYAASACSSPARSRAVHRGEGAQGPFAAGGDLLEDPEPIAPQRPEERAPAPGTGSHDGHHPKGAVRGRRSDGRSGRIA